MRIRLSRHWAIAITLLCVIASALAVIRLWPKPSIARHYTSSTAVYDARGQLLRLTLAKDDRYRLWLPLESISPEIIEAFLLQEDRWFYLHLGVNPLALARGGWRTIFASDSATALAILGTRDGMQLDAILIDQWNPGIKPTETIAQLREQRPALPILVLTSNDNMHDAVDAMRVGATDYLAKPIAPDRLLAALNATLDNCQSKSGELRPLTEKLSAPLAFNEIVGGNPQFLEIGRAHV